MPRHISLLRHPKTMADLDDARLGKQRLETLQILRTLNGDTDGYANHPAVQMWAGYEPALILYGLFVCHEWRIVRGRSDKLWGDFAQMAHECGMLDVEKRFNKEGKVSAVYMDGTTPEDPPWLKDRWVLRSHRSNLMRKAPHIYGDKYDGTPENMPYLWPVIDPMKTEGYYLRLSKPDMARLATGERVLPTYAWINDATGEIQMGDES
ncbi:MAG: MSMEG_6728 family protein [Gemmatimonadetes bacterium]|nr:MSMEG_6728 family protein [Gemmatimonadota bacterium]